VRNAPDIISESSGDPRKRLNENREEDQYHASIVAPGLRAPLLTDLLCKRFLVREMAGSRVESS